jgi:reactive intermediate/imine deaminase
MTIQRFSNAVDGGPSAAPYSRVVTANGFAFVAGQVATDAGGEPVAGGIVAETHQTIINVRAQLRSVGLDLEDVVKVTVWLTDTADFEAFNAVYRSYFGAALPTRACVRADLMGPFRVEIEVTAALRSAP